ncbi:hypothetical protein DPMN_186679 [Dreissena polymorpha]|uniref:Uncharacterized protein n=1 Tax=Dreissena polymorpha TaxID=45954 RepID=A0A9D4DMM2_DREPO|nr:hypothetical protein DPMN_186679 [Dreissena polymorpha]
MKLRDLKIKEPPLTEDDGEFIDQLIKLLEPFKTAATVLCGEKYLTVSLIFNYKKLLTLHVTAHDLDSETISRVKAAMLAAMICKHECSLVDPRFRDIQFITDQNITDALAAIKNKMSTIALRMGLMRQTAVTQEEAKATADDSDQPPQLNVLNDEEQSDDNNNYKEQEPAIVVEDTPEADNDKKPTSALGRLFDVFITKEESSAADKVKLELNCYLKESRAKLKGNPIDCFGYFAHLSRCDECTAISSDIEIVVFGSADGTIRFWHGDVRVQLRRGHLYVTMSRDKGTIVALGDKFLARKLIMLQVVRTKIIVSSLSARIFKGQLN